MKNTFLLESLTEYSNSDYYPFHMPGHKRQGFNFPNPWSIDITEIEGFDNLHHPQGILQELQERAARVFHAKKSFCLVNGSTCGILSAISACVKPGGKILMSRNCHKSAYHGVYLRNLTPVYLMPEILDFGIMGSLTAEAVADALKEHPDIQAVLVVSPTYDGVVSDIRGIGEVAHSHGIPLIVDEAHGAHFSLDEQFPGSALQEGADLVIQSLHKTLPAFTQTALLHLQSDLVDESSIRRFLGIYQSSSPSYLLMASIDSCLDLLEKEGTALFKDFLKKRTDFYKKCKTLKLIQVFNPSEKGTASLYDWDNSKILISAAKLGLSGQELQDVLLKKYHIQLEMAAGNYALALSSLLDTQEGFSRLYEALKEMDQTFSLEKESLAADIIHSKSVYRIPRQHLTPTEALEASGRPILLKEAAGSVSREYLYLYPPGIPLVAPGEVIDESLLENIEKIKKANLPLEGLSDTTNARINIVNF